MNKITKYLELFSTYILGSFMLVMTAGAIWQVFSRYVLNSPSTITEELLRYMLVWGTMLGAIVGFVRQEHMALTLLSSRVSARTNWWVSLSIHFLIVILFAGFFTVGGIQMVQNGMRQLSATLGVKMGFVYLIIPITAILISIVELGHIVRLILNRKEMIGR
ncbi:TRAP transporter small permease [Entomospira entomophila]|uniref:TRAP transporter small permease n=1 Tax=Entomospira entomophila TaxID=2719988 RepID=A0A968G8X0_9SPIO|nr:TRAP transporter small permease [Entomospira entomophilus]NIZ40722.1 TRAP transporter small permease [Entomospira entomophilus]WDI34935.1 TRAP transporter small permease [Entomospira entomophilus]